MTDRLSTPADDAGTFVTNLKSWERLAAYAETQPSAKRHLMAKTLTRVVAVRQQELDLLREMNTILQQPTASWYRVVWHDQRSSPHSVHVAAFDPDDATRRAWVAFTPEQTARFKHVTVTVTEDHP